MATSQHVEMEAAKFLHKLIQESTDEPAKLATKLYVICQHMKLSGKEQSLPYQVISRAMETVINQHGLDIDVLKSSRLPLSGGPQIGDSGQASLKAKEIPDNQLLTGATDIPVKNVSTSSWQVASSIQTKEETNAALKSCGMKKDSKTVSGPSDVAKHGGFISNRPPVTARLNRVDNLELDVRQGSIQQRSTRSSEHESSASIPTEDSRSTNSQGRHDSLNLDKQTNKKVTKRTACKRKRANSKAATDVHSDKPQQSDSFSTGLNTRKGKQMNKGGVQRQFGVKGDDHSHVNTTNHASHQDHTSSVPNAAGSLPIARQGDQTFSERTSEKAKYLNSFPINPTSKLPEEGEVSSAISVYEAQNGGFLPSKTSVLTSNYASKQNKFSLPSGGSQDSVPRIIESLPGNNWESKIHGSEFKGTTHGAADTSQPINSSAIHTPGIGNVNSGTSGAFSSYAMGKTGFSATTFHNNTSFESQDMASKLYKERSLETNGSQLLEKGKDTAPGKSVLHEGGISQADTLSYNISQGSGVQKQKNKNYVPVNSELLYRNQNFFAKPMSESNLRHEQTNNTEMSALKSGAFKDTGLTSPASASSSMPFMEQHLKQLRAQCLVFLAFRNNMMPRKLHLEIALGGSYSKEGCNEDGTQTGRNDGKSMDTYSKDPGNAHKSSVMFDRPSDVARMIQGTPSTGSIVDTDSSSKDAENTKKKSKMDPKSVEENKPISAYNPKLEPERWTQETAESHAASIMPQEHDSLMHSGKGVSESHYGRVGPDQTNQQNAWANRIYSSSYGAANTLNLEGNSVFRTRHYDDPSKGLQASAIVQHEATSETAETYSGHFQTISSNGGIGKSYKPVCPISESNALGDKCHSSELVKGQNPQVIRKGSVLSSGVAWAYPGSNGSNDQRVSISEKPNVLKQFNSDGFKIITANDPVKHGIVDTVLETSAEQEEENRSESSDIPTSPPKYRTSEKWIMDYQKKRQLEQKKWALKQKKAEEKVTASFDKLKENVNSFEDISAKTKSVIELKKLQLLKLQRRLRSDFLSDCFKPITSDMERLKSIKKHRHGRRVKQLEKFEQKMKEERQKRIRERQKEFFGEVEVHKEKLEDCFKIKRERWKNFNKFVKEFHKRKERIHREKIDRIQREKINLLKNNDVEGYLRMVQDAKSDRVKQLLKETEKYLQKLGSKVQEAKGMARRFEMEMDDSRALNVVEKNEFSIENEDESDQAQHYLESNEKYYMMAHSVKESINEQPTSLEGGKLREYQMNGLRWLVSLYNNHLNGILADEMGLGKTVQVIALICYLMESKNDRGPFLVVVPSSVLPGWISEISFWAPSINKIAYAGPPEERRRLFKERIVHQKFNVLLTTYEYLMNKHDRPKLSKIHWHYIIIDEGHRIKNASCKLNSDLKHYQSSHRLLLSGTPLQNNLDELWALLNFLLPNIFNSSEDFSQWFNKPFESNADNSLDETLLSEEENLLIINRLHQVLRPFLLRRLKHKVENELPEKIERLVRCEASAYQKLLMKRVEENLGSIGNSKGRSIHNTVMELRNICNHPYLSHLHTEEVNSWIPMHYLPPIVRLCGKLEMLDRLLPKLKATDHRVLFFSTMTRLLDVMEEYLSWKQYKYLRLDGHTSGSDRGALIDEFNRPGSQAFIFLLSIRAGGVGVNLQAADTVIIFDTDWNPQVDLQAQARAHRIGQKKDVLVLRLETVRTVEEQVRAAAEHKLGVANQSITAGFFDNYTSAEDRKEYLENLLRECKKEEAASILDDDALNDLLARSESEIEIFESVDKQRREGELATWQGLIQGRTKDALEPLPMPSRLVTEEDLKPFYKAMMLYEKNNVVLKHKSEYLGSLDTQHYGRGKRAREVRSYEDQWTEEEFEKLCQVDSPESPQPSEMPKDLDGPKEVPLPLIEDQPIPSKEPQASRDPPVKKARGRPKRATLDISPHAVVPYTSPDVKQQDLEPKKETLSAPATVAIPFSISTKEASTVTKHEAGIMNTASLPTVGSTMPLKTRGRKVQTGETPRKRGRKQNYVPSAAGLQTSMVPALAKGIDGAPTNGPIIDHLRDDKSTGTTNVPSANYEVNPTPGLQKVVDLASVKASSSSQEQNMLPSRLKGDAGSRIPAFEIRVAPAGVESLNTIDPVCFLPSKMLDMKSDMVQATQVNVLSPSTPAVMIYPQDLNQKHTESLDISSTGKQKEEEKQYKSTQKFSFENKKQSEKLGFTRSDITQGRLPAVDVHSHQKQKPNNSSHKGTLTTLPSSHSPKPTRLISVSSEKAANPEDSFKTIEVMKQEEIVKLGKTPDLMCDSVKLDPFVVADPSGEVPTSSTQDINMLPSAIKREPEKKASVIRKKSDARVLRNRSSSVTASSNYRLGDAREPSATVSSLTHIRKGKLSEVGIRVSEETATLPVEVSIGEATQSHSVQISPLNYSVIKEEVDYPAKKDDEKLETAHKVEAGNNLVLNFHAPTGPLYAVTDNDATGCVPEEQENRNNPTEAAKAASVATCVVSRRPREAFNTANDNQAKPVVLVSSSLPEERQVTQQYKHTRTPDNFNKTDKVCEDLPVSLALPEAGQVMQLDQEVNPPADISNADNVCEAPLANEIRNLRQLQTKSISLVLSTKHELIQVAELDQLAGPPGNINNDDNACEVPVSSSIPGKVTHLDLHAGPLDDVKNADTNKNPASMEIDEPSQLTQVYQHGGSPKDIRNIDNVCEAPRTTETVGSCIEGRNSEGRSFPGITSIDLCSSFDLSCTREPVPAGVDLSVEMSVPIEEDLDDIKSDSIISTDTPKFGMADERGEYPNAKSNPTFISTPVAKVSVEVQPVEVTEVKGTNA